MPLPDIGQLIRAYFPEGAWGNADCIMQHECPPTSEAYPAGCVKEIGVYRCNSVEMPARAWGPFGLLDVCWDPAVQALSPFTPDQWSRVLDPNYNVWMASRIWSEHGWTVWTTFNQCHILDIGPGGAIPHPAGPLPELSGYPPRGDAAFEVGTLLAGGIALGIAYVLYAGGKGSRQYGRN